MNSWEMGRLGEEAVAQFLERSGYKILDRNYRIATGEIDIIFLDGEYLVFGEVKTRSHRSFGQPKEAVNFKKQSRIIRTANHFMMRNNIRGYGVRFDVFEVYYNIKKIRHIKNAYFCV